MLFFIIFFSFMCSYVNCVKAFVVDNVIASGLKQANKHIQISNLFSLEHIPAGAIVTNPAMLKILAQDSLNYINKFEKKSSIVAPAMFTRDFISLRKTKETLQFIIDVISEDEASCNDYRILQSSFIQKYFGAIKWLSSKGGSKVRLTKYTAYKIKGSRKRTQQFNCALYKYNGAGPTPRYTKQQVLAGAIPQKYNNNIVPLVWLAREGLEEALMQGTIFVDIPEEPVRAFKVHSHNGYQYVKGLAPRLQKRYWYFSEVSNADDRLSLCNKRKDIVFAGDLHALGIGKVLAVRYTSSVTGKSELRLGILADTGGAFKNNLYQLDYFVGVLQNKSLLNQVIQKYPMFVEPFILYKKSV